MFNKKGIGINEALLKEIELGKVHKLIVDGERCKKGKELTDDNIKNLCGYLGRIANIKKMIYVDEFELTDLVLTTACLDDFACYDRKLKELGLSTGIKSIDLSGNPILVSNEKAKNILPGIELIVDQYLNDLDIEPTTKVNKESQHKYTNDSLLFSKDNEKNFSYYQDQMEKYFKQMYTLDKDNACKVLDKMHDNFSSMKKEVY